MSLMSIGTTVKIKVVEFGAQDLSHKAESGALGRAVQKAYVATKGYKSTIGIALLAIATALGQYAPPKAELYLWWLGVIGGILGAAGLVDKAYRKQPIFEPWFLEALAKVTGWISVGSAITGTLATQHVFDALFPNNPCVDDLAIGIFASLTSAAGLLNRLAVASATQPPTPNK